MYTCRCMLLFPVRYVSSVYTVGCVFQLLSKYVQWHKQKHDTQVLDTLNSCTTCKRMTLHSIPECFNHLSLFSFSLYLSLYPFPSSPPFPLSLPLSLTLSPPPPPILSFLFSFLSFSSFLLHLPHTHHISHTPDTTHMSSFEGHAQNNTNHIT